MAYEQTTRLLEKRLKDNWALTPIAFDNVEYVPKRGEAFIRATITQTLSELTSIPTDGYGSGNYREYGLLTLQVFTPKNEGSRPNAVLADGLAALYRGYNEARLFCNEARVNRIGSSDEFYQTNVLVEFYYDNCLNA